MSLNSEITTDAVPSPSRDGTTKPAGMPCNKEPKVDFMNNIKKQLPKGFAHIKRMKLPTAQATIINISNSPGTHVGDTIVYNLNNKSDDLNSNDIDIEETAAIKNLKSKTDRVSKSDIDFVSTHLNKSWRDVARNLGYSDGQIEQFVIDNREMGIKEAMYQLLLDWYQNEPSQATVGKLCTVLWDNNQKEVVKLWSKNVQSP